MATNSNERKLVRSVRVRHDDGTDHVFAPGDDVPEWAVEKIANPGAWGEGVGDDRSPIDAPADPDEVAAKAAERRTSDDRDDGQDDGDDGDGEGQDDGGDPSPARSSRGSSRSPRAASRGRTS